jgi:hypothetical protein
VTSTSVLPDLAPDITADLSSCAGGFFDGKTSAEERQRYLLDTIRTTTQQQQRGGGGGSCSGARDSGRGPEEVGGASSDNMDGSGGSSSGALSDAQLNRLLARGDAELDLFEVEDRRVQVGG